MQAERLPAIPTRTIISRGERRPGRGGLLTKANDGRPRVRESMHIISRDEARRAHRRVIAAGIAGNVMEWYDFAVYGYFARTIGQLYFPAHDQTLSLMAAFGTFAIGFFMRPLGAVLFGFIGDRVGRAHSLLWSVAAMALPTFAIGLLPTYQDIGITASVLMLICRILQGLAVGGEYTGSVVFLAETAPPGRR